MIARPTIVLALLALLSFPAGAGVYKWKDANGKVHYGDIPPSDQDTKALNVPSAARATNTPALKPGSKQSNTKSDSKDEKVTSGLYSGLSRREADKIKETCQSEGKNMSLAQIRDNYCGMEYAGCRALREYLQETENATARHRGDGQHAQELGDAMTNQIKAKLTAKGC